jgi:hypothetical protein
MSLAAALDRVAELQTLLQPAARPAPTPPATAFASVLGSAQAGVGTGPMAPAAASSWTSLAPMGGTGAGRAALAAAQGELGVAEQPPGSNDSPRIAQYRSAVAGAPGPGPWCAYFVSWAARQAGTPLGEYGQGFGRVDDVWAWGERSGRTTQVPQPGDLVVWDEHIGIVESVAPDGSITTVEGNSSDQVARRSYGPGANGAIGYVRLG